MSPKAGVSKGELEVARVVWTLGEATPRQVFEAYANERNLDFTTVQTYLRRLEAKGHLRARRKGKAKFYSPRTKPATVVRETIDDLVDRLFDGEALPLMRHLIHRRGMNDAEIRELREELNRLETERDDS